MPPNVCRDCTPAAAQSVAGPWQPVTLENTADQRGRRLDGRDNSRRGYKKLLFENSELHLVGSKGQKMLNCYENNNCLFIVILRCFEPVQSIINVNAYVCLLENYFLHHSMEST